MELKNDIRKLEALTGSVYLDDSDSGCVAAHVIDGIIDNEDCNGPGTYSDWTAAYAVELYADEHFLSPEGLYAEHIDWDGVRSAVAEALRVLQLPLGVVLVNADDGKIHAIGTDTAAARAEIDAVAGTTLHWELAGAWSWARAARDPLAGRYEAYEAPLGDWTAGDTWRVMRLAAKVEYWINRAAVQEAA